MKYFVSILSGLFLLMSFSIENKRDIIVQQFQRMEGEWEGLLEFTSYRDNTSKQVIPAKCKSAFDGNAWKYEVTYDGGKGEHIEGDGECVVNHDGSAVNYNGIRWDVTDVLQSGDTTRIVMETKGKDNRKKASLRQTLEITSGAFILTEEVRYDTGSDFFVRNKHLFRKRK